MSSAHKQPTRPDDVRDISVAVIGAGLMGHSIAGVFASAGATVAIHDPDAATLEVVPGRVRAQLTRLNREPSAADEIRLEGDIQTAVEGVDVVIEAVPERLALKQDLFERLGQLLPDAVLATNTSVLRIGEIAARAQNPERVIGTHWFNPPHRSRSSSGPVRSTSPAVVDWMMEILKQAGKVPVHVHKDTPGFVGNRIQHAMWREAISLVDEGVCDAATADLVVRSSFGLRLAAMGPLENADYVGLDLTLAVHEYLFPTLCADPHPSQRLQDLVANGELGAKTGSGFAEWKPGQREEAAERLEAHLISQLVPDPSAPR